MTGPVLLTVGMALWGVGMGTQESIMRAVVAGIVPWDNFPFLQLGFPNSTSFVEKKIAMSHS